MKNIKARVLILSLVLILTVTVGGTVAFLIADGGSVQNIFNPSHVSCQVTDNQNGTYTIKNTGDIAAYLRIAVVVNWVDANGDICYVADAPAATISAEGWTLKDDYHYFPSAVNANTAIAKVITVTPGTVSGYTAQVEIVAQAIQSVPANVVTEAWGYTPGN